MDVDRLLGGLDRPGQRLTGAALGKPFSGLVFGSKAWLAMVFTTYLFVFYFLPLVLVSYHSGYGLCRWAGTKERRTGLVLNSLLALTGYLMLASWYSWCLLLLVGITLVTYVCGRIMPSAATRPASRPGRHVRRRREPGDAGNLQSGFFEAGPEQLIAWFGPAACAVCRSSCRLVSRSHFTCGQLHHRRRSRRIRSTGSVVPGSCLLPGTLSTASCGAHRPLQHGGRPARQPLLHLGRNWLPECLVRHGVRQGNPEAYPMGRAAHAAFTAECFW